MRRRWSAVIIAYVILILWLIFTIFPFSTTLLIAMKPKDAFLKFPPNYFSLKFTWENFKVVLQDENWMKYYIDTIIIASLAAGMAVSIGSLAAYSFARYEFKFKNFFMMFILALQMIPPASIIIPLYGMFSTLNLLDTYFVLMLVDSVASMPVMIWLMRGYFSTIPRELEEAAYIDGCSGMKAFWLITFPLAAPGIAASAIYSFVRAFNDFIMARTLAGNRVVTYTVGLTMFTNQYEGIDLTLVSAAALTALVPILVMFSLFHKYFIIGMTGGALKE